MRPFLTIREESAPPPKLLEKLRESYDVLIVKRHDDVRVVDGEAGEMLLDFALQAMNDHWAGSRDVFAKMVTDHVVKTRALRRQEKKALKVAS